MSLSRTLARRCDVASFLFQKGRTCRRPHSLPVARSYSSSSYGSDDDEKGHKKTALVVGSSGAVGSTVAHTLSQDLGMQVLGADVIELPPDFLWELDGFVTLPRKTTLPDLTLRLSRGVHFFLQGEPKLDAIVVAAGGWKGDPESPPDGASEHELEVGATAYAETIDRMMKMNFDPVVASGYVAQHYMADSGLFVAIGATAALGPTPGMLGYGLSKAGAHHLVQTLGACTGKSMESKATRKAGRKVRKRLEALDTMSVVGILPTKIDTPSNREAEPDGDFDQWTKSIDIANEICKWIETPPLRPHSGSLVKVTPKSNEAGADFELVR